MPGKNMIARVSENLTRAGPLPLAQNVVGDVRPNAEKRVDKAKHENGESCG
jgi:hypothetical protein